MQGHLFLTGFMASGKSAVGRAAASLAGVPFVDLDERIATRAGSTIAELFARHGEGHFRKLERAAVEEVLSDAVPSVVALGGGALLLRSLRLRVLETSTLVALRARPETLLARAAVDGPTRPLLKEPADVELLLEQRESAYAEAHEVLDVDVLNPAELATRALTIWKRRPVGVASGLQSYSVEVTAGGAPARVADAVGRPSQAVLIVDATVDALYGLAYRAALASAGIPCVQVSLTPGEEHKNPAAILSIWEQAQRAGVDRKAVVIGLGGGVATDVAGFAAATWLRGLPWVSVPTTMLGMVDASVGGKTAVDLGEAKNCIGAFWQPARVVCDVSHLKSEPLRGFRSGLAEVVKTALLGDAALLDLLEANAGTLSAEDQDLVQQIVTRCVRVKASVVSRDPKELGLRASLNLGHTIGHALESCDGYGKLTHGEAVSLGLVAALKLGAHWGVTDRALVDRVTQLLNLLGLPTNLAEQPLARAAALLGHDKKRGGKSVKFVLAVRPEGFVFREVPLDELQQLTIRLPAL
jgi:shikimate kinase / 3-dehydroquinate synthase